MGARAIGAGVCLGLLCGQAWVCGHAWAAPARPLTLGEAIGQALDSHNGLRASDARTAGRRGELAAEQAAFDPRSSAGIGGTERRAAGGGWTPAASAFVGLDKLTRAGASLGAGLQVERAFDGGMIDAGGEQLVGLGASLTQPLGRGMGDEVATAQERAARERLGGAEQEHAELRAARIAVVAARYWALVTAQQATTRLTDAQERAERLLEETRVLVQAHERPSTELHLLEASSAERARGRMAAELATSDAAHALALALGGGEPPTATTALPAPTPAPPRQEQDSRWVERAAQARPILAALTRRVQAAVAEEQAAADAAQPRLDLVADGGWHHLDPLGAGGQIGLSLQTDLPLSDPAADGRLRAAQAAHSEAQALLAQAQQEVAVAVRRTLDALRRGHAVLDRAEAARTGYVEAVRAERAKLKAGFSTVFQVTILEDRLTAAELDRLSAWGRYMADVAQLWFVTGSLAPASDPAVAGGDQPGAALLSLPPLPAPQQGADG